MTMRRLTRPFAVLLSLLAAVALCAGCARAATPARQLQTARSTSPAAPPALPSSFYGYVAGAPAGAVLTAAVDGVVVAEAALGEADGRPFYALNVPADDPATPAVEGGGPAATVTFQIDGRAVAQTAPWRAGGNTALDLTAAP